MDTNIHEPVDPRSRNPFSIWLVVADIYNETELINWLVDVALILWLGSSPSTYNIRWTTLNATGIELRRRRKVLRLVNTPKSSNKKDVRKRHTKPPNIPPGIPFLEKLHKSPVQTGCGKIPYPPPLGNPGSSASRCEPGFFAF